MKPEKTVSVTVTALRTSGPVPAALGSMYVCMYGHHHLWQSIDEPGNVASPARDQLKRESEPFPVPVCA